MSAESEQLKALAKAVEGLAKEAGSIGMLSMSLDDLKDKVSANQEYTIAHLLGEISLSGYRIADGLVLVAHAINPDLITKEDVEGLMARHPRA